ncbi:MAG: hypothetical protein Q4C61_03495 [Lachnospiraceae bacterium]|nr:hypothetical protein [Lachnospiraceae bacterium]
MSDGKKIKCVGYVKSMENVDCLPEKSRTPAVDIAVQEANIRAYCEENRMELLEIYRENTVSDTATEDYYSENHAFERMRSAGIGRSYDLIVLDNTYCFGPMVYLALEVLVRGFYPAGIHFISLAEGFDSREKTPEEMEQYFRKSSNWYRSRRALLTMRRRAKNTGRTDKTSETNNTNEIDKTGTASGALKKSRWMRWSEHPENREFVENAIVEEHRLAAYASMMLKSAETKVEKRRRLIACREEMKRIFLEMTVVNAETMPLYNTYISGKTASPEYEKSVRKSMLAWKIWRSCLYSVSVEWSGSKKHSAARIRGWKSSQTRRFWKS